MSITVTTAQSIQLSHNFTESLEMYYLCNVTELASGEMKEVNKSTTANPTNVTGLLPDTTYRVDCVAYHSDGVEYCLDANTTVTTREQTSNGHSKLIISIKWTMFM